MGTVSKIFCTNGNGEVTGKKIGKDNGVVLCVPFHLVYAHGVCNGANRKVSGPVDDERLYHAATFIFWRDGFTVQFDFDVVKVEGLLLGSSSGECSAAQAYEQGHCDHAGKKT